VTRRHPFPLLLLLVVAACGGGDSSSAPDAPPQPDAIPLVDRDLACFAVLDRSIDGTTDGRWAYTYDAGDRLVREELDERVDSTLDEILLYTYDGDNLVAFVWDDNADGTPEYREDITYDATGKELTRVTDFDADGAIDWSESYEYDAEGRLAVIRSDTDGNGEVDALDTYVYVDDRLDHVEIDSDLDGTVDGRETHTYDVLGRVERIETDEGLDGTKDMIQLIDYDTQDRVVGTELTIDFGGDGTIEFHMSRTITYDAQGRIDQIDSDFNEDLERLAYEYLCPVVGENRSRVRPQSHLLQQRARVASAVAGANEARGSIATRRLSSLRAGR
jgi:hypothetical protein